ncbi:MAG: helix-turn-helix domain-containing protein [Lewinella sp.]
MNYDESVATPNNLYISGLLSDSSLLVEQTGRGGGYAMKVHPVIGYYWLRMPLCAITDRQVKVADVIRDEGKMLTHIDRIDSFDHPQVRQFFRNTLPPKSVYRNDPIFHAVNEIATRNGIICVERLAKRHFMSVRTFHRHFIEKVGLSPKAYAKIWQLQYAMKLIQQRPELSLERLSYAAGYYDAAHLAGDFKTRVSLPPTTYRQYINPLSQQYLGAAQSLL